MSPTRDQLINLILRETTDKVTADGVQIAAPNILEVGCRHVRGDPRRGYENPAEDARQFAGFVADAVLAFDSSTQPAPLVAPAGQENGCAFLLMKRDLYYRPSAMGYTGIKDHAGRYTQAEAEDHADPIAGVSAIRESEAPDFSPACFPDLARNHLAKKLAEARVEIERLSGAADGDKLRIAGEALEIAHQHIQHMAAWITKTNASDTPLHGYSFEALGEDKWIIDQARASLKGESPS